MGRRAHLLRLALGRSADLPPDWASIADQYERVPEESSGDEALDPSPVYRRVVAEDEPPHLTTYDEKGRPVDLHIRELDERRCEAQNAVTKLGVASTAENDDALTESIKAAAQMVLNEPESEPYLDEDDCGSVLAICSATVDMIQKHWVPSLLGRLLVFESTATVPLAQQISTELKHFGYVSFFMAGLPTKILTKILGVATEVCFDEFESRLATRLPESILTSNSLVIGLNITSFCFEMFLTVPPAIYYTLQELHLMPVRRFFPPLSSWNPWSSASPLHSWTTLEPTHVLVPAALITSRFLDSAISTLFEQFETEVASPTPSYFLKRSDSLSDIDTSSPFAPGLRLFRTLQASAAASSSRGCIAILHAMSWARVGSPPPQKSLRSPHNDTELSTLPSSNAGGFLRTLATEAAFLAFRAFLMRAIALSCLAAAATPAQKANAAVVRKDVYPLLPDLTRRATETKLRHFSSIGLCLGFSAAINLASIGATSALAMWMGKRWYDWGKRKNGARRQKFTAETRIID